MTNKRGTVISDNVGNSKRSNESDNEDGREERMTGGGNTLPLTPIHSLLLTINTLLIVSPI